MPNVRADQFYAVVEGETGIEEYREYRGDVQLAASSYESALGGDIVAASDYIQGKQGAQAAFVQPGKQPSPEQLVEKVSQPKLPQRTINDLEDPYNSPMLDGFLQSEFEPFIQEEE